VCKFLAALKNGGKASMPFSDAVVIDMTSNSGKMIAAAKERKSSSMDNLTMAFQTENSFGLTYKTMSNDWPAGLAHKVVNCSTSTFQTIGFQEWNYELC
jgi:hypothetical protein